VETRGPARDTILLDKYRVESVLGFGGMGLVIKAHHLALDEKVAIKILRDDIEIDHENVERFLREAQSAVKLKSEHVARIRDVGVFDDGKPFMVMELLEGVDLGHMIDEFDRVPVAQAVDLVLQACDALAEAHSLGIIHRDVKPTNLFVARRRDGSPLLKVLDFGISKAPVGADLSLTQTASMLGTPAYMSPEQMRSARTVDARCDIWSLGTVLYELVEGQLPFEAQNFAELCVMVSTEAPRPMTHAPQLAAVVECCLAKDANARFPSMAELAHALQPFASNPEQAKRAVARIYRVLGKVPPGHNDSSVSFSPKITGADHEATVQSALPTMNWKPRRRWPVVAGAVVLIGVGIGAGLWYPRDTHDDTAAPSPAATVPSAPPVDEPRPAPAAAPVPPAPAPEPPPTTPTAELVAPAPPPPAERPKTATVKKTPTRRPPRSPAHPPRPPHPPVEHPASAGSALPPPAKCDPFDARKKC
jgi:serine/threonine-protein kinase